MGLDISYYKLGEKVEVDENIETWSEEFYEEYGHDVIWLYSNYEMEQSALTTLSEDAREGNKAFKEKRQANFKGK